MKSNKIQPGVAVLGCGTVGGATAKLLFTEEKYLQKKTNTDICLKYIVDLDFSHAKELGLEESLFETDFEKALSDPEVGVVVELVGGTGIAKTFIEKALNAGKHVVTANKALLAEHGIELFRLARKNHVSIAFEASCAGGIPIIRALCDGLSANSVHALYGIVNGTCNYILTAMDQRGESYENVLREAQESGLAEADPTLDVSGMDSAHKLTIMSSLAYSSRIGLDTIPVHGIDSLNLSDVEYGKELGYVIKLLAVAQKQKNGVSLRVRPAFISKEHPLAWVSGAFNAVSVYSSAVGHTMYYGRGAGGSPTASAVASDILSLCTGSWQRIFDSLTIWPDLTEKANQLPPSDIESRFYIRMTVQDSPGMLAKISKVFGDHGISLSSVLQKEISEEQTGMTTASIVITTHAAIEGNMKKALSEIDAMPGVTEHSICISIVEEDIEFPG
ncbi:MAG: homoserine dehydrogenase [Spirochaetia bacterium]